MTDDEYDEGEHIKETFARFGLAVYMASVLETGLVHALLQIDFMTSVRDEIVRTKGKGFDRKKYEADFDAFMTKHFSYTMGNLAERVEELTNFDDALRNAIKGANRRRNLVHHYWREMAVPFSRREGRTTMMAEPEADANTFEKLDIEIRAAMRPTRERLGIKEEVLNAHVEETIAKVRSGLQVE
jgi:hypothetical protein